MKKKPRPHNQTKETQNFSFLTIHVPERQWFMLWIAHSPEKTEVRQSSTPASVAHRK